MQRWNKSKLEQMIHERLGKTKLIIVSNREPYVHSYSEDGDIGWSRPVGGLTEALDPVMRASGGCWVAHGAGDADERTVDGNNHVAVPPDEPSYTLRRVFLTEEEEQGYYIGFANEGLWPLCHVTYTPPVFRETDWEMYRTVNGIFAEAVLEEAGGRPAIVLVQDYHIALLPGMLRERNAGLTIGQFWHIPWPPHDVFRTCPWRRELLEGMLGSDLLGFHTRSFCENFIDTAESVLGVPAARESGALSYRGRTTYIEPFPISVDYDAIAAQAVSPAVEREMADLVREHNLTGKIIGVGMDRLDYTKGIPERLRALGRLFADYPEYRGRVVFIQAGMPSRTQIVQYRHTGHIIEELTAEINEAYGTDEWQPVVPIPRQLSYDTMNALRRLGDFCIVSSLHDGMNLVAKEYASARSDGDGVLILSEFTGAAAEMTEALLVNPYDEAGFAAAIRQAIEMPEGERRRRMQRLRETVAANTIYRWGADMITRLLEIKGA